MKIDLDAIEAKARKAQERSPGPWRLHDGHGFVDNADKSVDYIMDSSPRPDWMTDADEEWNGNRVLETDGGYYEPKGATAEHIAACSPDVVLAMVARIRELGGGLGTALSGWAIYANADYGSHPERPDSITDAELCDQGKIEQLRRLLP